MEQACWMWRLGTDLAFDIKHCTMHFFLDLANPKHEDTAKKLVHHAVNGQDNDRVPRIWNLRLSGKKKMIQENSNMWAALVTDTFTPKLEFDCFGANSYDLLGKTAEDIQSLTTSEKLEIRSQQAKRKEHMRYQQLFGYWQEHANLTSSYKVPAWATLKELNKALVYKAPWLAAWDDAIRRSIYLEPAEERQTSLLRQIFEQYKSAIGKMACTNIQDLFFTKFGFTKTEVTSLIEQLPQPMKENLIKEGGGDERNVSFNEFVKIFMADVMPLNKNTG